MNILITGHRGFIGKRMVSELNEQGYFTFGYDLQDGDDIRDEFKMQKKFEDGNFDVVIHLAARAGVRRGEEYREEFLTTNVLGTDNVLRMADRYKVPRICFDIVLWND